MRCLNPLPDIRTLNLKSAYKSSKVTPYELCSWVNANMHILENKDKQNTIKWIVPTNCWNKETYDRVTRVFSSISPYEERDLIEEIKNINKHIVLCEVVYSALNKHIQKR